MTVTECTSFSSYQAYSEIVAAEPEGTGEGVKLARARIEEIRDRCLGKQALCEICPFANEKEIKEADLDISKLDFMDCIKTDEEGREGLDVYWAFSNTESSSNDRYFYNGWKRKNLLAVLESSDATQEQKDLVQAIINFKQVYGEREDIQKPYEEELKLARTNYMISILKRECGLSDDNFSEGLLLVSTLNAQQLAKYENFSQANIFPFPRNYKGLYTTLNLAKRLIENYPVSNLRVLVKDLSLRMSEGHSLREIIKESIFQLYRTKKITSIMHANRLNYNFDLSKAIVIYAEIMSWYLAQTENANPIFES